MKSNINNDKSFEQLKELSSGLLKAEELLILKNYKTSSQEFVKIFNLLINNKEKAMLSLIIGLLNYKIKDYQNSIKQYNTGIQLNHKEKYIKSILYYYRSEANYKTQEYKASYVDRVIAKNIIKLEEIKRITTSYDANIKEIYFDKIKILDYLKVSTIQSLFSINIAKYDLIKDYLKVINTNRKLIIVDNLYTRANDKYHNSDYKASIRSLRRLEKYL